MQINSTFLFSYIQGFQPLTPLSYAVLLGNGSRKNIEVVKIAFIICEIDIIIDSILLQVANNRRVIRNTSQQSLKTKNHLNQAIITPDKYLASHGKEQVPSNYFIVLLINRI